MTLGSVSLAALLLGATCVNAQSKGTDKTEYNMPFPLQTCTAGGSCTTSQQSVTLDANWRWTHNSGGYTNCYSGNSWSSQYCPDPATCTANCVLEGVTSADFTSPYGITPITNGIKQQFVTSGTYGKNVGSRVFLLDSTGSKYHAFRLKNKEFTFDVDASQLPCGLNGALYFSEMDLDGGSSKYSTNTVGAKYGTGYCDSQCPHDIKWIGGKANSQNWVPSSSDPNSGTGYYGTCCAEMDIWEANSISTAFTAHPCTISGSVPCSGIDCGDDAKNQRYQGVCDKDGCDMNTFRANNKNFYGPGSSFTIDSTKPVTVVTQFITDDGTDTGDLVEIKRFWVQNGVTYSTPNTNVAGLSQYNSLSDSNCANQKDLFGETNDFAAKGGLKAMGDSMDRGWVLVMSIWDDHAVNMLWLDSIAFPTTKDPSIPGVSRGTCATTSGAPSDVEANYPTASVKYSNVKIGPLGSTFKAPTTTTTNSPTTTPAPTNKPTAAPTKAPTTTAAPTKQPTKAPTSTAAPTNQPTTLTSTQGPSTNCRKVWQQCGGKTYTGSTCCQTGYSCKYWAEYFSQCVPPGYASVVQIEGTADNKSEGIWKSVLFSGVAVVAGAVIIGVSIMLTRRRRLGALQGQVSEVLIPMQEHN